MNLLLQTKFVVASFDDLQCESYNSARAVICCEDCHQHRFVCVTCDLELHKGQPFHDREVIINGFYDPIPLTVRINNKNKSFAVGK